MGITRYGTIGHDYLTGTTTDDQVYGLDGDDSLFGFEGNDYLNGGAGSDSLYGGSGHDTLDGSAGNDYLGAGAGNDVLYSSAGQDTLAGGDGDDTYVITDPGAGHVITEVNGTGIDTIVSRFDHRLEEWIENLTLTGTARVGLGNWENNLILGNTVSNWLEGNFGNDTLSGGGGVDTLVGGAGDDRYVLGSLSDTVIEAADGGVDTIVAMDTYTLLGTNLENLVIEVQATTAAEAAGRVFTGTGNERANRLEGDGLRNALFGLAGNDTLLGYGGDDWLEGGTGDDLLDGGLGNGTLHGGAGNDTLRGDEGVLDFHGGAGDDTLLTGGTASMTAYFGLGDSRDTIAGHPDWASSVNTLQFTGAITLGDIVTTLSGNSLVLTIRGTTDSVTLDSFYNYGPAALEGPNIGGGMTGVQLVKFTDGTSLTLDDFKAIVFAGTPGADTHRGTWQADTMSGGAGADSLMGNSGDDLLAGGTGNDTLLGGEGRDVIMFNRGDGQDLLARNTSATLYHDVLQFGTGISETDINVSVSGSSVVLSIRNTTDSVTIAGFYNASGEVGVTGGRIGGPSTAVQQVRFASGAIWSLDTLKSIVFAGTARPDTIRGTWQADTIFGGAGNDVIHGFEGANVLHGGDGHDTLYGGRDADLLSGGTGNDFMVGGAGDDTLNGAAGSDVYCFGFGGGHDLVQDIDRTLADVDVLQFLSGIDREQVWLRKVGTSLEASVIGTSDKVTIQNWYSSRAFHIEKFQTADGRVLLDTQVDQLVNAMAAFAPPAAGQTTLPATYQAALAPLIATSWR